MCVCVCAHAHTWGGGEADGNTQHWESLWETLRNLGAPGHVDVMRLGLDSREQCLSFVVWGVNTQAKWTEPAKPSV